MKKQRCSWCGEDPLYVAYHDQEWGVPLYDDRKLFEFLILEGMQSGLSWITILKRRESYRKAFAGFDPEKIALFSDSDFIELMKNPGIIRNKLKIQSVISNARAYLNLHEKYSSFSEYIWQFTDGEVIQNKWVQSEQIPALTPTSKTMAKELKKQGFSFVGPTTCYAFMQAVGMVNDHRTSCFRHKELL